MKPIEIHYPRGKDWDSIFLTPGNLIKYRLDSGIRYFGIFLGLTPVSPYHSKRLDVLVGGKKQDILVSTMIELEVVEKTIARYPGEMFYRILWNGVLPDGYTRNAKYTPGQLIKSL